MGGKSGEAKIGNAVGGTAGAQAGMQPQMLNFGNENTGLLTQQLASSGLLSALGNPSSVYQPVKVPLIESPGMLQAYLHSIGQPYINDEGKSIAAPVKGSTPSTTDPTKKPTGSVKDPEFYLGNRGGERR